MKARPGPAEEWREGVGEKAGGEKNYKCHLISLSDLHPGCWHPKHEMQMQI